MQLNLTAGTSYQRGDRALVMAVLHWTSSVVSWLLALLAVLRHATPPVSARVTATWIDVEDHEAIIVGRNASRDRGWLQNATNIAHTAGLRFAADAQVGWAFAGNSADPTRPVHQQVMDIVDEITLMDYFSLCSTTEPEGPAGRCNPLQAMYLAAPWISYASFLATTRNHSVLLDIGVSLGSSHGGIQSELDLEVFLNSLGFLHGEQGGENIHNYAVFENGGYEAMAKAAPCPVTDKVCAGPASTRPARAIWWYGLLHEPNSSPPHAVNMVLNATEQHRIIDWCKARHVTELYIDQWSSTIQEIQASFEEFVDRADAAGIDLQLCVLLRLTDCTECRTAPSISLWFSI